jgi:hypothetical protein
MRVSRRKFMACRLLRPCCRAGCAPGQAPAGGTSRPATPASGAPAPIAALKPFPHGDADLGRERQA